MTAPAYTDDTVTSCDTCPFSVLRHEGRGTNSFWCVHPKEPDGRKVALSCDPFNAIPEWCPSKEGPALVMLKPRPRSDAMNDICNECFSLPCHCGGERRSHDKARIATLEADLERVSRERREWYNECKQAEADLELARAEVAYLRAWQAWAHRELDRHEISGELPDDPEPVPPEGVAP